MERQPGKSGRRCEDNLGRHCDFRCWNKLFKGYVPNMSVPSIRLVRQQNNGSQAKGE